MARRRNDDDRERRDWVFQMVVPLLGAIIGGGVGIFASLIVTSYERTERLTDRRDAVYSEFAGKAEELIAIIEDVEDGVDVDPVRLDQVRVDVRQNSARLVLVAGRRVREA